MIASDRKAIRVGSALLVVDGTDEVLDRKAEISIRPSRGQSIALEKGVIGLSRDSYNASLQHRRDAWQMAGVKVTSFDEFGEIAELRELRADVPRFGIQVVRSAIKRADEAFQAFFRRVGDGEKPGYPRFKSARRFRTAFYDEPVSWALRRLDAGSPAIYVQGVGEIGLPKGAVRQLRRLTRRSGEPRTLTITHAKSGAWRACVGFRRVAAKPLGHAGGLGGLDRGITVTAALSDGSLLTMPRFLKQARETITELSRQREVCQRYSPEWRKASKSIAKVYRIASQRSENWARHAAIEIVTRYDVIAMERLGLTGMIASASGTADNPGKGVKQKQGLNRSLQDAALGRLACWICIKAEEAGRRVWKVDARNSSRTCAACGHTAGGNRRGTAFRCLACGHLAHADVNAAQVLSARGRIAETAWAAAGRPLLTRPKPRLRRHKTDTAVQSSGAGSAPHAVVV